MQINTRRTNTITAATQTGVPEKNWHCTDVINLSCSMGTNVCTHAPIPAGIGTGATVGVGMRKLEDGVTPYGEKK